ncbi:MAG: hypothetical protein VX555_05945, partial [Pseudomonadota bacterium]|nr:hypothetical protein [Pseudomonadota bacterium]
MEADNRLGQPQPQQAVTRSPKFLHPLGTDLGVVWLTILGVLALVVLTESPFLETVALIAGGALVSGVVWFRNRKEKQDTDTMEAQSSLSTEASEDEWFQLLSSQQLLLRDVQEEIRQATGLLEEAVPE